MGSFELILLLAATWRLSYLIAREDAPFGIMRRIRAVTTLGGLLDCIYCASVWCAFGLLLIYPYAPVLIWGLAISGLAMLAHRYTGGNMIE
jgi:hypothetical protein